MKPSTEHDPVLTVDEVLQQERSVLRPSAVLMGATAAGADDPLRGLCISGGGIRSATFGLGAIQGLAEAGLLTQFDYLSTVSGGGYIGSWLTAWATRAGGLSRVIPQLADVRRSAASREPGHDPVHHLRDYNSYMSPATGAFSSDLWTLLATIFRNIVLNWLVLVPLVLLVLMVPRLYLSVLAFPDRLFHHIVFASEQPNYGASELNAISGSLLVAIALPLLSLGLFSMALFNTLRYLPGVGGRPHTRDDYTLYILAPLFGAVLTFLMFDSLYYLGDSYKDFSNLPSVIAWTTIPCAAAWLLFLVADKRSFADRVGLLFGPMSIAILVLAAGTGAATWLTTNYLLWSPNPSTAPSWSTYVTVGPPLFLLGFILSSVLFVGLSSRILKDDDREWMSRAGAGCLLISVEWLLLCLVVLILPEIVLTWQTWGHGVMAAVAGASAWITSAGRAPAPSSSGASGQRSSLLMVAVSAAPVVFVVLFGVGLVLLTNLVLAALNGAVWHDHGGVLEQSSMTTVVALAAAFLALSAIMARYVNINTFSLHGMYRDRLVRAFLGASNFERRPNAFTGFDRHDDLPMTQLAATRPFHVVNLTLNLVEATRLDWQQRKAAAFTITPLHCGSADLGYRDSARYAGGVSLGTAVSISGAAASPNMGAMSSPLVGFIMTLFNARLGCWLGNPGRAGTRSWTDESPRSAIGLLVREALGLTTDRSAHVYLSDGGHFENLGLYELVRRRCRYLVVIDSGCDPTCACDDLGNALRKIRIDLGVPIDFDDTQWQPLFQRKRRSAVATIRYSCVDASAPDGHLVYIKPVLLGNEAPDVRSYALSHAGFPHQSTADQWFDESQTESYRQLGAQTIRDVCAGWTSGSLADLCGYLTKST